MRSRLFHSQRNKTKSTLEISVTWHSSLSEELEYQIKSIHLASFSDLHKNYKPEDLGLKPDTSKEEWIMSMIDADIADIKAGKMQLATAYIQDSLAGFLICRPPQPRGNGSLKVDIYVSLLAVKPLRNLKDESKKIHIGLGSALIESVMGRYTDANAITLDTWLVNGPGLGFYRSLGFTMTGRQTFGGNNPDYYTGCEKSLKHSM